MRRRRFMAAAAALPLAGCMGYTVEDESRIRELRNERDRATAELNETEADLADAENRADALEADLADATNRTESLSEELAEARRRAETEEAEQVLVLYATGLARHSAGTDSWNRAMDAWDAGNAGRAARLFGVSSGAYYSASGNFSYASDVAHDQGMSEAAGTCRESMLSARYAAAAANKYAEAANHYSYGEDAKAESDRDAAERLSSMASDRRVAGLDAVEDETGATVDVKT